jgi:hypothetical protein
MTAFKGVISYPIPLYANVPIHAEYYQPSQFVISAIDLGPTTIITATTNLNYVIGQEIRLLIPASFGTIELNERKGLVISIPALNQVEIDINSIGMSPFIAAVATIQSPQILAIGDVNNGIISTTGPDLLNVAVTIPGAFENISPL